MRQVIVLALARQSSAVAIRCCIAGQWWSTAVGCRCRGRKPRTRSAWGCVSQAADSRNGTRESRSCESRESHVRTLNNYAGEASFDSTNHDLKSLARAVRRARLSTGNPPDEMDFASEQEQRETEAQLKERRWARFSVIDTAFERLRLGQYGVCEECGDEISLERLRAVPYALCCLDCQHERESKTVPEASTVATFFPAAGIEPGESNLSENHAADGAPARSRSSLAARQDRSVKRARTSNDKQR